MSKYIIKNCPAYCYLGKECHNKEGQYGASCCEVTDCVMKQIVELCEQYKKHSDCGRDCPSFGSFLNKLLDKLDIQGVLE